ncbi:MAG: bleomycin resistance protein [Propionicimonas sp.]
MVDHATPNLPSRDFADTIAFYSDLGFRQVFRDPAWLILGRGDLVLEFFPFPELDPATSSSGSCLRLDDVDAFYALCKEVGIPEKTHGWPRIQPPRVEGSGLRIGALLDPDGTLLRLIQNPTRATPSQQ